MRSAHLPDLRIVPIGKLIPHEKHDDRRAIPLIDRFHRDAVLKNPPIATPLDGENLVILDGANRVTALDLVGVPHILVQVVPYRSPSVRLSTWRHVVIGPSEEEMCEQMAALGGVTVVHVDRISAQAALARRLILAYCLNSHGEATTLSGGGTDLHKRTDLLNLIVDTYIHNWTTQRSDIDDPLDIVDVYPGMTGVIVFPQFEPAEILDIARARARVPAGITRHIIQGRVLRLNYPLHLLAIDESLEKKNEMLQRWLRTQFDENHVRFYQESTFLFDE
jgi:hypothetical protein